MIAFGPVPSRRLGYSLGINHIPPKHCSYSCIYCQVGRTNALQIHQSEFFSIQQVFEEVKKKVEESSQIGRKIDYLTLVPDGEPTLDIHISSLIEELRDFHIPIAMISNGSLINRREIQDALLNADWVSVKIDSVNEEIWRKINRPHHKLSLPIILNGMIEFRKKFQGKFVTETMFVSGVNDDDKSINDLCDFLIDLQPDKSYLAIPIRPPAEIHVRPPNTERLKEIIRNFDKKISFFELLFDQEISDFLSTGDLVSDILSITAVHPLREAALRQMVNNAGENWKVVEELLTKKEIIRVAYQNDIFYFHSYMESIT